MQKISLLILRPSLQFILCCGLLTSCSQESPKVEKTQAAVSTFDGVMGTVPYRLVVGKHLSENDQERVRLIIDRAFGEIDFIFNKWNQESELSRLNQLPAGEKVNISPQLEWFLIKTGEIVELTEGRFDPTVEPLSLLWKDHLSKNSKPSEKEQAAVISSVGWDKVHFENGVFWKDHDDTQLDLGGIAKGYWLDLVVERLNNAGFDSIYADWGGDIRTAGEHPEGRPWKVGWVLPGLSLNDSMPWRPLADLAMATSGDYWQNWTVEIDGKSETYFHIIDPTSKQPVRVSPESVAVASVVCDSCLLADGLATAAMIFSNVEEAQEWAEKVQEGIPGSQFYLFDRHSVHQ